MKMLGKAHMKKSLSMLIKAVTYIILLVSISDIAQSQVVIVQSQSKLRTPKPSSKKSTKTKGKSAAAQIPAANPSTEVSFAGSAEGNSEAMAFVVVPPNLGTSSSANTEAANASSSPA